MCDINLVNVGADSCEPVAGLSTEVLIAPVKDFTVIGEPPATLEGYEDVAELATVSVAHTFPVGKGFTSINGVEETGNIKTTMIGDNEGHLFQNELAIEVRGSSAAIQGYLRLVKNLRFIALATEIGSGNVRQIGSKLMPARFSGIEAAIEAAMEGKNSVTITMMDKQKWPAPVYPAGFAITMQPAT